MEIYKDDQYCWEEHEMTDHFMDYKNPQVANLLRGYPGGEKIRLGVLFFDKTGRPYFVRHLADRFSGMGDHTTKKRNVSGNHLLKHYEQYSAPDGTISHRQHNGQATSLIISEIDITDVKDQIGGFAIVRTDIVHTKIGSGLIGSIEDSSLELSNDPYGGRTNLSSRKLNTYVFYSPESLFDLKGFEIQSGDKIENAMYLKPYRTNVSNPAGVRYFVSGSNERYQKIYEERNSNAPATGKGRLGESDEILYSTKYNLGDDDVVIDPRYPNVVFKKNVLYPYELIISTNCLVIVTKEAEVSGSADHYIGRVPENYNDVLYLICDIKRENNNPYGGLSDASLSNSIYRTIGHYQEVNDDVLSDIEKDGRFIFDDIQVFGGDTFVNLFGLNRTIRDYDVGLTPPLTNPPIPAHSIVFPCESRVNIAMREGNSLPKDLPWDSVGSTLGLKHKANEHKWEEFNYNDGYSSDDIKDFYLPMPYNWESESLRPARIRYSFKKNYGELKDSFRIFPPLQLLDLDINDGEITNIREKSNRLIYWQRNAIGYIPINERALTQNAFGQPIQLGIGGIFERYDKIINTVGNSNQFGLVENDYGFHWYDAVRKILVSLSSSMELNEDSIINGMDNFFSGLPDMSSRDNPIFGEGISAGYDYKNKTSIFVFHLNGATAQAVGINMKLNTFLGNYTFPAGSFMTIRNNLVGIKRLDSGNQQYYLHTDKVEFGEYYGMEVPP